MSFWKRAPRHDDSDAGRDSADPATVEAVRREVETFRPYIQSDGGDIEFRGVDSAGVVRVRLKGACVGCPASFMTLQLGIERRLREVFPFVREVRNE